MKTFAEIFIDQVTLDELDLDEPYYDGDEPNEVLYTSRNTVDAGEFIDIQELKKILANLEQKGANKVYIGYHSDHHGYEFCGVKLKEVNEDES